MRVSFYANKEVNCLKTETKNFLLKKKNSSVSHLSGFKMHIFALYGHFLF